MNEKVKDTLAYIGTFALGSIIAYGISKHLGLAPVKPTIRILGSASRDISRGTGKVDSGLDKLKGYL